MVPPECGDIIRPMPEHLPRVWPVSFEGVSKSFDGAAAVSELDLRLPPGELFGLIGPNGAGKTTTIKMAVGLVRPSRGRVMICGYDAQGEGREARRQLGYVPDTAALYDRLTGSEMLQLAADLHGVPLELRRRREQALVEAFNLGPDLGQLVLSYSRGMRQKLAICAALLHDPQVIFLDEPTVGLDPSGARELKLLLRGLCRSGRTVFLSTHALEVAAALCDRVGIFHRGQLAALGTVAELESRWRPGGASGSALEDAFMAVTGAPEGEPAELVAALRA